MHTLYLISVWLHILAATTWLGGMSFLILVVVPWLRKSTTTAVGAFLHETGRRFRDVSWSCFSILFVTGSFNLWFRGVRFADFMRKEWLISAFGAAISLKLTFFLVVMALSAVHDFGVGPRATAELARAPGSRDARVMRRRASLMGRANALLALVLVALGVVVVRGWPR